MTITKFYCDHCQNEVRRESDLRPVVVPTFVFIYDKRTFHVCKKCAEDIENYIGTARHTKPPLGLVPRFIRDEARVAEILKAVARYNEVGKPVPVEWLNELNEKIRKEQPGEASR